MGLAEYFCQPDHFWFLAKYGRILGKTLCSGPRNRQGQTSPWEHRPSSSAPCAVPMILSRIDQHIRDEPCAKLRALLGVSSSRYSSVSRGVRSAGLFFSERPLVYYWKRINFMIQFSVKLEYKSLSLYRKSWPKFEKVSKKYRPLGRCNFLAFDG